MRVKLCLMVAEINQLLYDKRLGRLIGFGLPLENRVAVAYQGTYNAYNRIIITAYMREEDAEKVITEALEKGFVDLDKVESKSNVPLNK